MIRELYLLTAIALGILEGCATYHRMPLDRSAVTQSLTPPSMETVRVEAKAIKHPILKPLNFDDRNGLSPDEAAILAVLANPTLRAIRDQRGIVAAQLLQAGILPNPQLSFNLAKPTGGSTQGTVTAFGFGLNWDITSLITRSTEIDAARAQATSIDLDVAWQEWQVAQGAKLHVYRLVFLKKQLATAREEEKGLQKNLEAVKRAVDIGDMTVIELAAAEATLQRTHLSVLTIEQQQEQERLALNKSLGLPPEQVILLQQDIDPPSTQALPSLMEIMEGIEKRRLDLLALKMGYQSQEARLRAAILAQFPRINIGFSESRDNTNIVSTGFGITIDLPFFDRNQGHIAIERATRTKLFDEYIARLFETKAEVARILEDIRSIKKQIEANQKSILASKNLVQISYKGLLEGNVDVLSYYNARSELIAKQIDILKLKQNLADLIIALEIAAGRYLR